MKTIKINQIAHLILESKGKHKGEVEVTLLMRILLCLCKIIIDLFLSQQKENKTF